MIRKFVFASIAILSTCLPFSINLCSADLVLVGYDTTNPNFGGNLPADDLPAAESQAFINPLNLSRGAGLIANNGIVFNSRNWSTSSILNLNSNQYIQWGWSSSTRRLDLTDLTLQYDRSDNGPTQLAIALSINSGEFVTIFNDNDVFIGDETHSIDLNAYSNVESAVFRLFGFDARTAGGTLDIEEFEMSPSRGITVSGNLTAIPEPNVAYMFAFIAVGIIVAPNLLMIRRTTCSRENHEAR